MAGLDQIAQAGAEVVRLTAIPPGRLLRRGLLLLAAGGPSIGHSTSSQLAFVTLFLLTVVRMIKETAPVESERLL